MVGTANRIKIAVVANCQSRPLADLLKLMSPSVEISCITVVHLVKDSEAAESWASYEEFDFVFAQAVQDNYPTTFVRTGALKQRLGSKVVTWPNIYFRGQCPDTRFVTSAAGRVVGPLGDYQNITTYAAWRSGLGVAETVDRMLSGGDWVDSLADEAPRSMAELRMREASLDVGIADHIAAHWQERRLFYTFNHPANELLIRVARDLLAYIGLTPDTSAAPAQFPEALDQFIPALLPPLAERLGLRYQGTTVTKGVGVNFADKVSYNGSKHIHYPIEEFVETSFRCLDAQLQPGDPVRIT